MSRNPKGTLLIIVSNHTVLNSKYLFSCLELGLGALQDVQVKDTRVSGRSADVPSLSSDPQHRGEIRLPLV